jgi:hypothetical protein
MPTLAFNSLISQLDDYELSCFLRELGVQNSQSMILKILTDEDLKTAQHILLSAIDFNISVEFGSRYWKTIFNRLNP